MQQKETRKRARKALDATVNAICDQIENPKECRIDMTGSLRIAETLTAYLYPRQQAAQTVKALRSKIPAIMREVHEIVTTIDKSPGPAAPLDPAVAFDAPLNEIDSIVPGGAQGGVVAKHRRDTP
jgi:nucleoid DNA-binding protein